MTTEPPTWRLSGLCDGEDEDGRFISWYTYRHVDGREATEYSDGSCSDPDLAAFLAAEEAASREARKAEMRNKPIIYRVLRFAILIPAIIFEAVLGAIFWLLLKIFEAAFTAAKKTNPEIMPEDRETWE